MEEYYKQLKEYINSYVSITDEIFKNFKEILNYKCFKKGSVFLEPDTKPEYLAFNLSGLFRIFYVNTEGKEYTKLFWDENKFGADYCSFINQKKSRFFVEALEDTKVFLIDYKDFMQLLNSHVLWQELIRKNLEETQLFLLNKEAEMILDNAKQRYINFIHNFKGLEDRVKQYHLASYLGISPITLSRIKN